ncbi:MAG: nuclear transport factor 2 family protein [Parasphingorhabdus sp.]|uniref:nuclear transport factor 2 family protein n=1 Tax=Parasphingorhabdus sp. TaxID=2709688 RepID=UPI00329761E5
MEFIAIVITAVAASQPIGSDAATLAAIDSTCHDYIDGQLEGDPDRVARSLHPDLAKRAVVGDQQYESFGLRRMSKEELVSLTKRGALKTPADKWDRTCKILDVTGNAASVRLETPWFVDYFHMGNFDGKWLIVNALWYMKK